MATLKIVRRLKFFRVILLACAGRLAFRHSPKFSDSGRTNRADDYYLCVDCVAYVLTFYAHDGKARTT